MPVHLSCTMPYYAVTMLKREMNKIIQKQVMQNNKNEEDNPFEQIKQYTKYQSSTYGF